MPDPSPSQQAPALKIVFFGAGAFGLPTLQFLLEHPAQYQVTSVITQPDRPAGRGRKLTPTPIAEYLQEEHPQIPIQKTTNTNAPEIITQIYADQPDVFLVIAFGQKLKPALLQDTFAINLHGSLLPKYRGAAPVQYALLNNETITGVSVITLADRMDAGDILFADALVINHDENAGELHDRLAELGPAVVRPTLIDFQNNELSPSPQDESLVTLAPKITKAEGTVDFANPADDVRARIHGLNPWPGCTVILNSTQEKLKIGKVHSHPAYQHQDPPGTLLQNPENNTWLIACGSANNPQGAIEIIQIQPPGKRMMPFTDYARTRTIQPGTTLLPNTQ